jgi:hypothetical protein
MAAILPEIVADTEAAGGSPLTTPQTPSTIGVPAQRRGTILAAFGLPFGLLCYVLAVRILCHALGYPRNFNASLYAEPVLLVYFLFSLSILLVLLLRHFLGRSAEPILWFRATWPPRDFLRRLAWALPLLLTMPLFLTAFTGAKNLLNDTVPFTWDEALQALSRHLEFGYDTYQLLPIHIPLVTRAVESAYAFWGVLFVAVPFVVSLRPLNCPLRTRFFASYALVLVLLGNAAAGLFMSAGPFWLEHKNTGHSGFSALFAYLNQVDPDGQFSAVQFQQYLLAAHLKGLTYLGTGISAFPSIHVAMATLFVLVAWPFGMLLRVLSLAFLAVIFTGSVELGWHYSVDGYAAIIFTMAIYGAVGWLQRQLSRRIRA